MDVATKEFITRESYDIVVVYYKCNHKYIVPKKIYLL